MRLLLLLAWLLLGRRALNDLRRIWALYTADRAPVFPRPDDYLPADWTTGVHQ